MFGKPWLKYVFGGKEPCKDGMAAIFIVSHLGYITTFSLQYHLLRLAPVHAWRISALSPRFDKYLAKM